MNRSLFLTAAIFSVSAVAWADDCPYSLNPSLNEATIAAKWADYEEDNAAREIREAAEREEDPDLRRKLWLEYDNYLGMKKCGQFDFEGYDLTT